MYNVIYIYIYYGDQVSLHALGVGVPACFCMSEFMQLVTISSQSTVRVKMQFGHCEASTCTMRSLQHVHTIPACLLANSRLTWHGAPRVRAGSPAQQPMRRQI